MSAPPKASELRAAFDAASPLTLGLEEELMVLDPETYALVPQADAVLGLVDGDERFKRELPASQLEIVIGPHERVGESIAALAAARRALAEATAGSFALAAAGVHPTAPGEGDLNRGGRYDRTAREYGSYARRQLVFALQVHVAPGGANRALAVYNALRSYLPELAALAANAPFHEGRDTGLASVRPKIAEQLPRQGVPPALESWEQYERALAWSLRAGAIDEAGAWWWELRPHPRFGTLELRVPDAQSTVAEAAGVAALAQSLVAWLAARAEDGEALPVHPEWLIAENRWWAARDGVEGTLADLDSGERMPAAERLEQLIGDVAPTAMELGCEAELEQARAMIHQNGAIRQRRAARDGLDGLAGWLASRWLAA